MRKAAQWTLIAAWFGASGLSTAQVRFAGVAARDSGGTGVLVADVDEDGRGDVVLIGTCSPPSCTGGFEVLHVDEAGGIARATATPGGSGFVDAVAADFDGDGHVDLAVTDSVDGSVIVFRGDGHGTFVAAGATAVGMRPYRIAAGDFDRDGRVDLFVSEFNGFDDHVHLLRGDGLGGFSIAQRLAVPDEPDHPVVVDVDHDGWPDVIVSASSGCGHYGCDLLSFAVLRNDGTGMLAPPALHDFFGPLNGLVGGDFDEDGNVDVALEWGSSVAAITLFRGDGAGGFTQSTTVRTGAYPFGLALGDLDGDGHADLTLSESSDTSNQPASQPRRLSVLLGDGHGGFSASRTFSGSASSSVTGDVNADGRVDLMAIGAAGVLSVHLGDGTGNLTQTPTVEPGRRPLVVLAADLREDGFPDLVITTAANPSPQGNLSLFLGTGGGAFEPRRDIDATNHLLGQTVTPIASGDFNEDGHADLVAPIPTGLGIHLGDGMGGFTAATTLANNIQSSSLAVGDFDNDGHLDLAAASSNVVYFLHGNGDGSVGSPTFVQTFLGLGYIVAADFDEDGELDVAGVSQGYSSLQPPRYWFLLGDGRGGFSSPVGTTALDSLPSQLVAGDVDGDGHQDVAIPMRGNCCTFADGGVLLLFGNGNATMRPPVRVFGGAMRSGVAIADFDGDGRADLAVTSEQHDVVSLLLGTGGGHFAEALSYEVGSTPRAVIAADLDADGDPDVAVANSDGSTVSVLVSESFVPWLDARRGNVNASAGPIADVLFVNGSAGIGRERRVDVQRGVALEIRVAGPPSTVTGPAGFVLWDWRAWPAPGSATLLRGGLGFIAMPTPMNPRRSPQPRFIANNVGHPFALGVENWPTGPTSPAPTILLSRPNGVNRGGSFYLQGLIFDAAGPNGRSAVTNGVAVRIW
ncbi:MAG: VCBS repeat-containing protein [Planctomycetes bacterium]|nr:VCBS repeat-containing protein [Planctomycetota bacterium]MBI3844404.1 VCBS repeat-containing protein [Planctomycetota bacterium]